MFFAQQENELVTDRPDQTESAVTVGKGKIQVETGFAFEADKAGGGIKAENWSYGSTLLRIGLLDNFEFRLGAGYNASKTSFDGFNKTIEHDAWDPVALGLKTEVCEQDGWRPQLALLSTYILNVNKDAKKKANPTTVSIFVWLPAMKLTTGWDWVTTWVLSGTMEMGTLPIFIR